MRNLWIIILYFIFFRKDLLSAKNGAWIRYQNYFIPAD